MSGKVIKASGHKEIAVKRKPTIDDSMNSCPTFVINSCTNPTNKAFFKLNEFLVTGSITKAVNTVKMLSHMSNPVKRNPEVFMAIYIESE